MNCMALYKWIRWLYFHGLGGSATMEYSVKSFKDKIVLNHVSFSMKPGEIVGFVGQNGAGKSTLMKCMCNLINMDEGTISICEEDVVKQREKALSYVSCMIEGPGLFENMTGKENLELMATLNHASKENYMK